MSDLLTAEDVRRDQILREAVDNAVKVVLTCRGADGWQTLKTAFAVGVREDQCLRLTPVEGPPLEAAQRVGVAFRRGHRKYVFSTVVEGTDPDGTLALRRPAVIQQMQRRVYQRACPPPVVRSPSRSGPGMWRMRPRRPRPARRCFRERWKTSRSAESAFGHPVARGCRKERRWPARFA